MNRLLVLSVGVIAGVSGLVIKGMSVTAPSRSGAVVLYPADVDWTTELAELRSDEAADQFLRSMTSANGEVKFALRHAFEGATAVDSWAYAIDNHEELQSLRFKVKLDGGRVVQPVMDPQFYRALARRLRLGRFEALAEDLADAHVALELRHAGISVEAARIEGAERTLQHAGNLLMSYWLRGRQEDGALDEWLLELAKKLFARIAGKQDAYHGGGPISMKANRLYQRSLQLVVAVFEGSRFVGSGFYVGEGLVLTARHVLDGCELGRVRVAFRSGDGFGELQEIEGGDVIYYDEPGDIAILSVESMEEEASAALRKLDAIVGLTIDLDPASSRYRKGIVYGLSATSDGVAASPVIMTPGPIVLASSVAWPTRDWLRLRGESVDPLAHEGCPDDAFFRAVTLQAVAENARRASSPKKSMPEAAMEAMARHYEGTARSRHLKHESTFVFGHNLWSVEGASGAGILVFPTSEDKITLIGVHLSESRRYRRGIPPSLDSYKQAYVLARISEPLRELIATRKK